MNKDGQEILNKLVEVHNEINTVINKQKSDRGAFHKTVLNIKNTFFEGIAPSATNTSINFYTVGKDNIETILKNAKENRLGIYIFLLKLDEESIEGFRYDWQGFKKDNQILKMPTLKFNEHHTLKDSSKHVLYIGKSENLSKRIDEHINFGSNSTSCLRLQQFKDYIQVDYEIEVCYLYSNNEEISSILYPLEKFLRETFPPLLGSAR